MATGTRERLGSRKPVENAFDRSHLMNSRFVLLSCWYATCAVLLAFMVKHWGGSLGVTTRQSAVAGPGHQDTSRKLGQEQAPDEAWERHEQAHREWESKVAAWQEAQLRREEAERAQAKRDRVRQDEPYKIGNLQTPRYAAGGPDVLGNVNRILQNASQNRQAYEQRVREGRAPGSQSATGPAPSLNPPQSLDSLLQGMQRQQELQLQEKLFGHHR
jgi:hypothetical protein